MNAPLKKPLMGEALLAKLTGRLGDKATVEKICSGFGEVYVVFLPDIIKSETNLDVEVAYLGCDSGHKNELVANLGDNTTLVDATLRNWSPNITLACGNSFIITLMEHLLGAAADAVEQPADRLLSVIELELAVMAFDKFANVLRSAVNAPGGFEPVLEFPHAFETRIKPAEDKPDEFVRNTDQAGRRQARRVRGRDQHVDHALRHHLGFLADRSPGCPAEDDGDGSEGQGPVG